MNPALITLAIEEAPAVISLLQSLFSKQHPGEPTPTNEQVIAAFRAALESSLAKDEAWLKAHPVSGPAPAPSRLRVRLRTGSR